MLHYVCCVRYRVGGELTRVGVLLTLCKGVLRILFRRWCSSKKISLFLPQPIRISHNQGCCCRIKIGPLDLWGGGGGLTVRIQYCFTVRFSRISNKRFWSILILNICLQGGGGVSQVRLHPYFGCVIGNHVYARHPIEFIFHVLDTFFPIQLCRHDMLSSRQRQKEWHNESRL